MICPHCGAQNRDNVKQCWQCRSELAGQGAPVVVQAPTTRPLGDNALMRMILPVGRSWVAIVAGYFGLLSLIVYPAPIAFLLGIAAVFHIKKHPDKHGMGRAIFAIVMGALGSAVLVLLLVSAHSH